MIHFGTQCPKGKAPSSKLHRFVRKRVSLSFGHYVCHSVVSFNIGYRVPTTGPRIEDVPAKTVIFCGEIPTCRSVTEGTKMLWSRCAQQFAETPVPSTSADEGKSAKTAPTSLAVVNMRSDESSFKEKQVRVSGSGLVDVTVASGVGVLSDLVAWAGNA